MEKRLSLCLDAALLANLCYLSISLSLSRVEVNIRESADTVYDIVGVQKECLLVVKICWADTLLFPCSAGITSKFNCHVAGLLYVC